MGHPVSSNSVEPEVGRARSICPKREKKDRVSSDFKMRRSSGKKEEGDITIPDA